MAVGVAWRRLHPEIDICNQLNTMSKLWLCRRSDVEGMQYLFEGIGCTHIEDLRRFFYKQLLTKREPAIVGSRSRPKSIKGSTSSSRQLIQTLQELRLLITRRSKRSGSEF